MNFLVHMSSEYSQNSRRAEVGPRLFSSDRCLRTCVGQTWSSSNCGGHFCD